MDVDFSSAKIATNFSHFITFLVYPLAKFPLHPTFTNSYGGEGARKAQILALKKITCSRRVELRL